MNATTHGEVNLTEMARKLVEAERASIVAFLRRRIAESVAGRAGVPFVATLELEEMLAAIEAGGHMRELTPLAKGDAMPATSTGHGHPYKGVPATRTIRTSYGSWHVCDLCAEQLVKAGFTLTIRPLRGVPTVCECEHDGHFLSGDTEKF